MAFFDSLKSSFHAKEDFYFHIARHLTRILQIHGFAFYIPALR